MSSTPYLKSLDGWRAIAILSVLVCHSTAILFSKEEMDAGNSLYQIMVRGHLGVDLFFAISGFLICTRILDDEKKDGFINFKRFYSRRFFRILPPYFFYIFILCLLMWTSQLFTEWSQIGWTSLFLQNYFIPHTAIHWQLGHFWSLAIEEHFYLLFPSLLFLLGNPLSRLPNAMNSKKNRLRLLGLIVFAFLIAFWRSYEFRHQILMKYLPHLGFSTRSDIRMDGLIWGSIGAILFYEAKQIPFLNELILRPGRRKQLLFEIVPFICISLIITFQVVHPPFELLWQSVVFSILLISTTLPNRSVVSSALEWAPLKWIGRMSYSLYLWNNFFLVPTNGTVIAEKMADFSWVQTFPFSVLLLFLVAWMSFTYIERPMVRIGSKLFSK